MDSGHIAIFLWYAVVLGGGCAALLVIARNGSRKRVSVRSVEAPRYPDLAVLPPPPVRPVARTVSSCEAHVVPHVVEIAPPTAGSVTRVFVGEQDVVIVGQALLEISRGDERWIVRSSVPGVVTRCRVRAGDAVERSRPFVSITRTDDVLVVARFDRSAGPSLRTGKPAWVRIALVAAPPIPATLISAAETGSLHHARATLRVVARLEAAPPDALRPRIAATVLVACDA